VYIYNINRWLKDSSGAPIPAKKQQKGRDYKCHQASICYVCRKFFGGPRSIFPHLSLSLFWSLADFDSLEHEKTVRCCDTVCFAGSAESVSRKCTGKKARKAATKKTSVCIMPREIGRMDICFAYSRITKAQRHRDRVSSASDSFEQRSRCLLACLLHNRHRHELWASFQSERREGKRRVQSKEHKKTPPSRQGSITTRCGVECMSGRWSAHLHR
jgi:hypothetical protein